MKNKQLTPGFLFTCITINRPTAFGDQLCECEKYCPDCCKHQQCFSQQYGTDSHPSDYKYLGTRFILGGSSITNGIDCATFTKQIYERQPEEAMPYPHTDWLPERIQTGFLQGSETWRFGILSEI